MTALPPISEETLQAYVDGLLPAGELSAVEAFLAEHPEEAARLAAYQHQNHELQALGDLLESAAGQHSPVWKSRRRLPAWVLHATSMAAALLIGVAAGWLLREQTWKTEEPVRLFTERALLAHRMYTAEKTHPVEVLAAQEQHLVAWLSKRVGRSLVAPSLQPAGYDLVGGRLLPTNDGAAAQFMYQNEAGQRLTLYINRGVGSDQETPFRYEESQQAGIVYWLEKRVGYSLTGPAEREQLLTLAKSVYMQLEHL